MSKLLRFTEFLICCSGPGCLMYTRHWFDKTLRAGKVVPDADYTVLVTNHDGLYRYITAAQNAHYERLNWTTGVLMVVFFVLCYRMQRRQEQEL